MPGLTWRNPSKPLNGARISRSRSRATMLLKRACMAPARDRATSSSEAEVKPRPLKSCNAAQLTLRIVEVRARFGEQRFLFLIRELDQHGAGFDVIAVLEIHAAHGVRDLRRQRHRLVGLRGAERLDDVVEFDRGCARPTVTSGGLSLRTDRRRNRRPADVRPVLRCRARRSAAPRRS